WGVAPRTTRAGYAWSDVALGELRGEGVALPATENVIELMARAARRPVLNARRRLVLVVHDGDEGRHALWSRLTSIAAGFNEIRIDDALQHGADALPAID